MTAVPITATGTFAVGLPETLFAACAVSREQMFSVTKDGERFLVNASPQNTATATPVTVIVNWTSTLQQ